MADARPVPGHVAAQIIDLVVDIAKAAPVTAPLRFIPLAFEAAETLVVVSQIAKLLVQVASIPVISTIAVPVVVPTVVAIVVAIVVPVVVPVVITVVTPVV